MHGGQWKLGRAGDYCLSQRGPAAGVEDAAERGAITASSTADAVAHGANMAVDGSSSTFWARLFFDLGIGASAFLLTSSFEGYLAPWILQHRLRLPLISAAPSN